MEKLISMTDYVLLDKHAGSPINMNKQYAHFLKQPLKLGMFFPCDEDGNLLDAFVHIVEGVFSREYQQAKERVLFEGLELNQKDAQKRGDITCLTLSSIQITFFKVENGIFLDELITNKTIEIKTIEDLIPYNLTLIEK